MKAVLDITDAAYYLQIPDQSIRDLVKHRKIPFRKRGSKLIFLIIDLDAWLKALPGLDVKAAIDNTPHPAEFRQILTGESPSHTPRDSGVMPSISLVKGPKGRNRERLVEG